MKKKLLKILIPVLSFGRAGGMRVLAELANHWEYKGCNVTFVSFYESEEPYYAVKTKIIWIDKRGNEVCINNSIFRPNNSGLNRAYALYRFLKRHSSEYDIVIANSNLTTWPIWLGSNAMNFYYIQAYEVEFNSNKSIVGSFKKTIAWLTYYLPLKHVVNSNFYKKYKNINCEYVIHPGLDFNIYYPKISRSELIRDKITIGCIGRKEEWKGSNDVGEAIKILRLKGYIIKFEVAFEAILYPDYELVIPDGDENLADFYRNLDIMVAPGHIQLGGVHYPVIESMACKTPVISTGYYPANNKNSFVIPIKRPDLIAETIITIIENYELAIEKAEIAYKDVLSLDWNIVSEKFLNVFYSELYKKC